MIIRREKKNKRTKNRKGASVVFILKKAFFATLLLAFFAVAFWTIFFSGVLDIHAISIISDEESVADEKIKQEMLFFLQGEYLGIFPKNNLLIFNKRQLKKNTKEKFREIRDISIRRKFPDELEVFIEKRQIRIIWCSRENCFLVDERGEAFLEFTEDWSDIPKVSDASEKEVGVGDRVASPEFVLFLEKITQEVERETGIVLTDELRTPSAMSEEVRVRTEEGWEIFFSANRKIEIQTQALKKIVQETIGKQRTKDLEYIDLRIKGRAIFKLRDQEDQGEQQKNVVQ